MEAFYANLLQNSLLILFFYISFADIIEFSLVVNGWLLKFTHAWVTTDNESFMDLRHF